MITAISWARESNQYDKNEYTLDAQIEANQRNAERDGLTISHTFREKFSGVDLWAMPELTRLRSLLQATPGKKVVYVYAQDRLDTAPPEIQRQILEALPFRYTLQGEILL